MDDEALRQVTAAAEELAGRTKPVELAIPNQDKLAELGKALDSFPPDAIRESLKVRDGRAYQVLHERGHIVKKNHSNRMEIAKLSIAIAHAGAEERGKLLEAVRAGALSSGIEVGSLEEGQAEDLARFMRRCGIPCEASGKAIVPSESASGTEVRLDMPNRCVWIEAEAKNALEENLRKMQSVNATIQLRNAERQIKSFNDEEESGFADLQKEYLDLLKQQDELLRRFNEEEKLSIRS